MYLPTRLTAIFSAFHRPGCGPMLGSKSTKVEDFRAHVLLPPCFIAPMFYCPSQTKVTMAEIPGANRCRALMGHSMVGGVTTDGIDLCTDGVSVPPIIHRTVPVQAVVLAPEGETQRSRARNSHRVAELSEPQAGVPRRPNTSWSLPAQPCPQIDPGERS
jgi:hypothetical protein